MIKNYRATRGRAKGNLKAASAEFSRFCSATASWWRVNTERRSTRKGDLHIEDFLSCSGDFFHFMLDGLRMRVRRKMATRSEDGGGTFMVPPVTRALLAAKSLAAGRSDSKRQDQSSKIKSCAIKNSVRNWKKKN
jgi:hypothetical protein